ncbi:hypothetical protein [Flavipsychrobacter stenotrophus]|nr:hypothetical protein [Flavipsychrobacter stenotrophus]
MQTAIVKPNQSSLDVVLMHAGTMEAAMEVMAANERSITAPLITGVQYLVPDTNTSDAVTLNYLQQNKIVIGTRG